MERIKTIHLSETDSTNRFLRHYRGEEGEAMTIVWSDFQTAGQGQGGNSWESERGKNLTFSMKIRPKGLSASGQFVLLQAAALAIADALSRFADGFEIKWPNDIYWRDRKISGTLSECAVARGQVESCIVGVGININQTIFTSDAPNPVSLRQITGQETEREPLLHDIAERFLGYTSPLVAHSSSLISTSYMHRLYRREGSHRFRDAQGLFSASIAGVEPSGRLLLRKADGTESSYAFKEVEFII